MNNYCLTCCKSLFEWPQFGEIKTSYDQIVKDKSEMLPSVQLTKKIKVIYAPFRNLYTTISFAWQFYQLKIYCSLELSQTVWDMLQLAAIAYNFFFHVSLRYIKLTAV